MRFILKLFIKNRSKLVVFLLFCLCISSFFVYHINSMWQKALKLSNDGSTSLSTFVEASNWLSKNLKDDQVALTPMPDVFYILNPELKEKLIHYKSVWDSAGIILQANTTKDEILKVRSNLLKFLKENSKIKYVVRDWIDPYAKNLYEVNVNDELMILLQEVEEFSFTLSTGWSDKITIYEKAQNIT